MTKDNKNLIEKYRQSVIIVLIASVLLGLFIIMPTETEIYNDFKKRCDVLYGKDNWSEYNADIINSYKTHQPLYTQIDYNTITCFKTGTIP